jgi:hypothetical protein
LGILRLGWTVKISPEKPQKVWNVEALKLKIPRQDPTTDTERQKIFHLRRSGSDLMDFQDDISFLSVAPSTTAMISAEDSRPQPQPSMRSFFRLH